ncbi:MAG: recombinase family protein [Gemmiger sp.]
MNQTTPAKTLFYPRAWAYARETKHGHALAQLCESARCAGYDLVGQSWDTSQRLFRRHLGRAALLRAVSKGLVDDVFVTRLSQLSRKRGRLRRILLLFQRKGVRVHTTEIELRYDLYRHGLDNALAGGTHFYD